MFLRKVILEAVASQNRFWRRAHRREKSCHRVKALLLSPRRPTSLSTSAQPWSPTDLSNNDKKGTFWQVRDHLIKRYFSSTLQHRSLRQFAALQTQKRHLWSHSWKHFVFKTHIQMGRVPVVRPGISCRWKCCYLEHGVSFCGRME